MFRYFRVLCEVVRFNTQYIIIMFCSYLRLLMIFFSKIRFNYELNWLLYKNYYYLNLKLLINLYVYAMKRTVELVFTTNDNRKYWKLKQLNLTLLYTLRKVKIQKKKTT